MTANEKYFNLVKTLYKNDYGDPFEMTEGQTEIFKTIYERRPSRVQIETYSQYGKTDIVSMAVLTRASTFSERWPIIAPSISKAKILIGQCIKHTFENDYTRRKFQISSEESEERIRRERSKNRLTYRNTDGGIGEIFILSSEARRKGENAGDILLGWGAQNVVEDESALIPDNIQDKVIRMLAGHKDSFFCKIGNTIRRNHFLKSHLNPNYKTITVDVYQGIKEGRITKERVEELQQEMNTINFSMLYECQFPSDTMITEGGWMRILRDEDIDRQMISSAPFPVGDIRMGVDVSGGGRNYSVIVMRFDNYAQIVFKARTKNTMDLVEKVLELRSGLFKQFGYARKIWIIVDAIGIGRGVYDTLKNRVPQDVIGIIGGEKAKNQKEFFNLRAENFWKLQQDILAGLKLIKHQGWEQLREIRYKFASDRRIKVMSKDEMFLEGIESPDEADALALTCAAPSSRVEQDIHYPFFAGKGSDIEIY